MDLGAGEMSVECLLVRGIWGGLNEAVKIPFFRDFCGIILGQFG